MSLPLAIVTALFLMPIVVSLDAWRYRSEAWDRVAGRRWFWGIAPAVLTLMSLPVQSFLPSLAALALTAIYAAKVRPVLSVADGLSRPRLHRVTNLTAREQGEVAELFLVLGGTALFVVFVLVVGRDGRERVIGLAMAAAVSLLIVARIAFIARRGKMR